MVDQTLVRDTEATAQGCAPDLDAAIASLVRLLARQAAREHLERLANPDAEEITDEG